MCVTKYCSLARGSFKRGSTVVLEVGQTLYYCSQCLMEVFYACVWCIHNSCPAYLSTKIVIVSHYVSINMHYHGCFLDKYLS